MSILKRVLIAEIEARLLMHIPVPGLVSFVHKYAIADQPQIRHMELLNEFIKLMTHEIFLHDCPGYWMMHITRAWHTHSWTQKMIEHNNKWLKSQSASNVPFHLNGIDFAAKTNLRELIWGHANSLYGDWTIREGDRYEESLDRVTAHGWWPILLVVKN